MSLGKQETEPTPNPEGAPPESESTEQAAGQQPAPEEAAQQERYSRMAVVQARTERQLRELQEQIRGKDEEVAKYKASSEKLDALRAAVKEGRYDQLESELGAKYDSWTDSVVNRPSDVQQAIDELRKENAALAERLSARDKKEEDQAKAQEAAAEQSQKAEELKKARAYVRENVFEKAEGESLGYLGALQGHDRVISRYQREFADTGVHPNAMTVAAMAEEEFAKEIEETIRPLIGLQKFRDMVARLQGETAQQDGKGQESRGNGASISNADLSEGPSAGSRRELSDEEAEARAFARMDRVIADMR